MEHRTVIYPAETAVIDRKDKEIVKCPTEDEAWEYIRDMEMENADD